MAGDIILNERYRLLQRVGSGGMATVFKAEDQVLRRVVAVKLLHPALTGDDVFLRRFQQEAHAAANLSHPNIVTVHDIGVAESEAEGARYFIVMEFVPGRVLKEIIRDQVAAGGGPLPISRALEIAIQIAAGIGYAHRAGIVHCDVKPQNVIVTPDDRVKVADFGIARAMSEASISRGNRLWGTPHYMAPEQAAGESATPASDVYAIGVILFEMLAGRLPFDAETLPALALKHMQEPPPLISDFNPMVPVQLEQIVRKVLSKEPASRYRTAGQLERILRSYRDSAGQDTGPIAPLHQRPTVPPIPAEVVQRALPAPHEPLPLDARRTEFYEPGIPVTEQRTAIFSRPERRPGEPAIPLQRVSPEPPDLVVPAGAADGTDWTAVGLGILAIIALLGLIPLWYLVARAWGVIG
ncbi:MAG: protein kinase [Anaerolineae bacterium]|nr:protein kinase [Anaerolineae bacterium]